MCRRILRRRLREETEKEKSKINNFMQSKTKNPLKLIKKYFGELMLIIGSINPVIARILNFRI